MCSAWLPYMSIAPLSHTQHRHIRMSSLNILSPLYLFLSPFIYINLPLGMSTYSCIPPLASPSFSTFSTSQSARPTVFASRLRYWESKVANCRNHWYHTSGSRWIPVLHRRNHIRTSPFRPYRSSSLLSVQIFPPWPCCQWCQVSGERSTFLSIRYSCDSPRCG